VTIINFESETVFMGASFYLLSIGKIISGSIPLECPAWVRDAVRIACQPSKLKVMGSNPIGPAIKPNFGVISFFSWSLLIC
jgi:hypothetical protein